MAADGDSAAVSAEAALPVSSTRRGRNEVESLSYGDAGGTAFVRQTSSSVVSNSPKLEEADPKGDCEELPVESRGDQIEKDDADGMENGLSRGVSDRLDGWESDEATVVPS